MSESRAILSTSESNIADWWGYVVPDRRRGFTPVTRINR
jgi:hypothetical protein